MSHKNSKGSGKLDLAVVIPAYNEEECIEIVVNSWAKELAKHTKDFLIFIVNDGSRDRTGTILDMMAKQLPQLRVVHQQNGGHGAAVLNGYQQALASQAKYIFQTDSDDQFQPEDFGKLWSQKNQSGFSIGYRAHRDDPKMRLIINKIMRFVTFLLYGKWLDDPNVPYRLMTREFLLQALQTIPVAPFAPNIFLSIEAAKSFGSFPSFPVTHKERQTGEVSIKKWKLLKVCFRSFKELILYRFGVR